jgi:hypothetical protein
MTSATDQLGDALVRHLHERTIASASALLDGRSKAPAKQAIQAKLAELSDTQKAMVLDLVVQSSVSGLHDFLFYIQSEADAGKDRRVRLLVGASEPALDSDGLHGELFGAAGWLEKFGNKK